MPDETVLVAEDHPDAREILKTVLEIEGFGVLLAMNGAEAVDLAVRHAPDLIFMDLMMPSMDGATALSAIRRRLGIDAIPVAAVTARSVTEAEMRQAGFCALLRKPFHPRDIAAVVRACIDGFRDGQRWIELKAA